MIMEGLAEQKAVYEKYRKKMCTMDYLHFKEDAIYYWRNSIQERIDVREGTREHDVLLNGLHRTSENAWLCTWISYCERLCSI